MRVENHGWDVGCNVERVVYNVLRRRGELYVAKFNEPESWKLIQHFKSMDSEVNHIVVVEAGVPVVCYQRKEDGVWVQIPVEIEHANN